MGDVLAAKARLDEVYAAYAEPDADFDKLAAEQAELEAIIAAAGSENTDLQLEIAADALRLPPWDAVDRQAVRRREAPRRAVPAAAVQARHAAARRTDQPPGRRIGGLAGAVPAALSRAPWWPSPTTATSWTTRPSGFSNSTAARGIPYKGNYSDWLEQKEAAAGAGAEDRRRAHQGDEEGAGVGAPEPQGPPGQEQGAAGPLRGTVATSNTRSATRPTRSSSRWPSAWATRSSSSRTSASPSATALLIDNLSFKVPAGAIVGIIGPNGAGKSTLFRMIRARKSPTAARSRSARP